MIFDPLSIRDDFPILSRQVHDKPLVYLDNAATTQKPQVVIDAMNNFYAKHNANVHRGAHALSDEATELYEGARNTMAEWINAKPHECVFTSGTTESINLAAFSFAEPLLSEGDEILISTMEHHSNIVPWQLIAKRAGAVIREIPVTDNGEIDLLSFEALLNEKTKIVALTYISNVLGTINPVEKIIPMARACGAFILLDGAQALLHERIDVVKLDCDFLALSAHKAFGPTGIGILYGKAEHLENMRPYQGGGEMIRWVSFDKTEFNEPPYKFEAGTPNISGAIGMKAAIDYLAKLDFESMQAYERYLWDEIKQRASAFSDLNIIGTAIDKIAIFTFDLDGVHANDVGLLMDTFGVAVRTGHHCAMPLMARFGLNATVRASFAAYNTVDELEYFFSSLEKVVSMVKK